MIDRISVFRRDELEDLRDKRIKAREAYRNDVAIEQLTRVIRNGKVFSKIETEEDRIKHNFVIEILEDAGLLDSIPLIREIKKYIQNTEILNDKMIENYLEKE